MIAMYCSKRLSNVDLFLARLQLQLKFVSLHRQRKRTLVERDGYVKIVMAWNRI